MQKSEEEGCLRVGHAQDLKSHHRPKKWTMKREGGFIYQLPGGQYLPGPNMLSNDPEDALLLKPAQQAPHLIIVPGHEASV